MKIYLKNGQLSKDFPMTVFEIQDTLDRLGTESPVVDFMISEYENMSLPKSLCRDFTADIYRLNLFVERYENLENDKLAGMKSLLTVNPDSSIDDMIQMTYGLDYVSVYPCSSYEGLGEIAVECDMLPELEKCDDSVIELLDYEKVGKLMCEREGGMFVDGYYCLPSEYESPDINIEIGRLENEFFRLLIAPSEENTNQAVWVSFPCSQKVIEEIRDMVCLEIRSSLPVITKESLGRRLDLDELNQLSQGLSELSHDDFIKLKAVMESQKFEEISDAIECVNCLDNYGFTEIICSEEEFGREYLSKNLPTNFDLSLIENINLNDFGSEIMRQKGAIQTSYGMVYGKNMDLFSAVTIQPEQLVEEDIEEEATEDFEVGMEMM